MLRPWSQLGWLLAVILCAAPRAMACAVCYGDPDAPMSKGLTWAVVVLVGMISAVLVAVSAFFVHISRRAHQPSRPTDVDKSSS